MGIKRPVDTDFWEDELVIDSFTRDDKLFWLYLLTNPKTRQAGVYKLPKKIISFQTDFSIEEVNKLLAKFENEYKLLIYSHETQEVALMNYLKRSVLKGGKPVYDCIKKDLSMVTDRRLVELVYLNLEEHFQQSTKDSMRTIGGILKSYINSEDYDSDSKSETTMSDEKYQEIATAFFGEDVIKKNKEASK